MMTPGKLGAVALLVVALAVASSSCARDETSPEQVFRTFVENVWRGQDALALEAIAPQARERLLEPLAEVEQRFGQEHGLRATDMLIVTRLDNPHELKEVRVVGDLPDPLEEGSRVELALRMLDDRQGHAAMVYQGGRWYVDLPLDQVNTEQVLVPLAPAQETTSDVLDGEPGEDVGTEQSE